MRTTARAVLTLVVLAVLWAAGAASVSAADDTLGATVEAYLYANEDRTLTILNRSTTDAAFVLEPTAGWGIDPASFSLAPGEAQDVTVRAVGIDRAPLTVRVVSTSPVPEGTQQGEIVLTSMLYPERPFNWVPVVILGALFLIVASLTAAWVVHGGRRDHDDRARWVTRVR